MHLRGIAPSGAKGEVKREVDELLVAETDDAEDEMGEVECEVGVPKEDFEVELPKIKHVLSLKDRQINLAWNRRFCR